MILSFLLIALFWLPVYAIIGGLYTVSAGRLASRFGRRVLVLSWAFGALAVTALVCAYSYARELSWRNPAPVRAGIADGADMFIPAALCFIGPTVLIARRLRNDGSIRHAPGMKAGAILTGITWLLVWTAGALSVKR